MLPYLNTIRLRATRMFITVASIMLPVMVIIYIADRLGLVQMAGKVLAPAMGLLGLPPEAGLVWATTILTSIYGGIAALAALSGELHLNVAQMSSLGAMMLFAHNIPTEQAVVHRAGANAFVTGGLRIGVGALYGAAVAWVCHWGGWLQEPVSLVWLQGGSNQMQAGPPDVLPWLWLTAKSMLMIWLIIGALVILLDALERVGLTRWFSRLLTPVLKLSGLDERAAPLVTVGMLMGLAYGGALIIDATQREHYSRRTLFLALCWLSLFHAVIEDTLLIAALGANVWVILVIRGVVVLAIMAFLAMVTRSRMPNTT